ncbi:palmitoyltransferase ZDHHC23-B-like isoform X2 [Ruditapes philippinarum]|uniref:palmitoyltransferase ZDHHC23-B-like isoform X2 n=1 Tax=Ruditapes philippinarum TaxID=129788 RepID=UPI00295BED8A|nr:palmitoyltransferase ZDHHC23-B-like isoform X2 [Ruditapes philippinarum]
MKMADDDVLCCCEYRNKNGEKSHLLACCCDCEALDQIADRVFKCEKIPTSLVDRLFETIVDRCRVPGLSGGGATQINLEVAIPVLVIPISLMICAVGPISTGCILACLPYFCFFFYRTWKRKTKKTRTKFFFAWGVTSLLFMYFLFEVVICMNTNVSKLENLCVSLSVMGMCVALRFAKKDPGIIPSEKVKQYLYDTYSFTVHRSSHEGDKDIEDFEVIEHKDIPDDTHNKDMEDLQTMKGADGEEHSKGANWCNICCIEKPPRAGHCTVCDVCIYNRDHHCVWIDSCVGARNHRSFLVAMTIFVFTSYYGGYLTLAAVCDPMSPHEATCSFRTAYRDFKWGLCYASAWYVVVVATLMLFGLIHQMVLISQNMTSQELHTAIKFGNTRCLIYNIRNVYNQGILQNWSDFFMKKRYVAMYETV